MKDIELRIVADNSQFINSAKQVEQATQGMADKAKKRNQLEKGLIEDITDEIKRLEEAKRKAYRVEDIEKYNKKIAEARQDLKQYNEAGVKVVETTQKVEKATNGLWNALKKLIIPLLTITAATRAFNAIMNSTQQTSDKLKIEISGLKFGLQELLRTIASGDWDNLPKKLKEARDAGREYAETQDDIGDRERELMLRESERSIKLAELQMIYRNTALKGVEGYKKRQEAAEEFIKLSQEGEEEALELLRIRLDNELLVARQAIGLQDEYKKAVEEGNKAEQERINNIIIGNLKGQKSFEAYKDEFADYKKLLGDLKSAEQGEVITTQVGDAIIETRRVNDAEVERIKSELATIPPEIVKAYETFEEWGKVTDPVRQKITDALVAIDRKTAETTRSTIRANTMAEMAGSQLAEEEKKTSEERLKQQEAFAKELFALQDQYEKEQIANLTGEERLAAEREYQLKQIMMLEMHLQTLGQLEEEHYKMLDALRANVQKNYIDGLEALQREESAFWLEAQKAGGDNLIGYWDYLQEQEIKTLEINGKATEAKLIELENRYLKVKRDFYLKEGANYDPLIANMIQDAIDANDAKLATISKGFSIWKILDPDDKVNADQRQRVEENATIVIDTVVGMMNEIYAQRVADAQRNRELIDDQIQYTTDALNAEVELMKAGYANNVDAKRKELEELSKEREKALKAEEKALKAQKAMDTAMQLTSLITASANILKGWSTIPFVGQILAIAAIAAMFGTFAAAKAQASKAAKLAKGGYGDETGVITGKSHSQGGERFLDNIEVERGEMWGVLNRKATKKYGKAFGEIVNNFNKDNLVLDRPDNINNVVVDVNQTNERLDKVEYQLIRLNNHFRSQKDVKDVGSFRIEKIGNKTRIIRK